MEKELAAVLLTIYLIRDGSIQGYQFGHIWFIGGAILEHLVDGAGPCNRDPYKVQSFLSE